MEFIFIYVTAANEGEAKNIAKHLLEKRLIACANHFPVKSIYRWEGKVNEDDEYVMIIKTKGENYAEIKEEIKKLHSYDVPCITKISVSPNEKYANWLERELGG